MFCIKCGTKLPDDANFCIKCGYSFNNPGNISQGIPVTNIPIAETKLVPAKCTNCNGVLNVDPSKEAAICPYCNSAFIVSKAINNIKVENAVFTLNGTTVNIDNHINADNYIQRAKEFLNVHNYSNAEEYLEKVLDQEPNNQKAKELMYILLMKEAGSADPLDYQTVIRAISKVATYANDSSYCFVTDYLCYLGADLEEKMLLSKQPLPLAYYKSILPYYEKAREFHPEHEYINLAISRMKYILDGYCFGACEHSGARYEIRADVFIIWKGSFFSLKRTAQKFSYKEVRNVQNGAFDSELVSFTCAGATHTVRIGFTDVKKFCNALNNAISGYYLPPSYKVLNAMKLVNEYNSNQYEIMRYYNINALLQELERIKDLRF